MSKKRDQKHEARIVAAARLAAESRDQNAIAEKLNVSQAAVSRLLKDAVKKEWLVRAPQVVEHRIPPSVREQAELLLYPHDLRESLTQAYGKGSLQQVLVFDSGGTGNTRPEMRHRLAHFGQAVAPRIAQLLRSTRVCSITWGRTLACAVESLAQIYSEKPAPKPVKFVPLCGDPLGDVSVNYSSSALSAKLVEILNGDQREKLSLTGVPAFIPLDFDEAECDVVKKLIRRMSNFDEIFPADDATMPGSAPPKTYWLRESEMLMTSVGPSHRSLGYSGDSLRATARISREELKALVVGDIGGVLMPRPDLTPEQKSRLDQITKHWMGIKREHLVSIREYAKRHGYPGIVVMVVGRDKIDIVLEAVKHDLVQELWIDTDLGDAIAKRLDGTTEEGQ